MTREVDGGFQTVSLKLPAIVTMDLRLNEPRYTSPPNIMKAKRKPLDETSPDAFGVDVSPRLMVLKTAETGSGYPSKPRLIFVRKVGPPISAP